MIKLQLCKPLLIFTFNFEVIFVNLHHWTEFNSIFYYPFDLLVFFNVYEGKTKFITVFNKIFELFLLLEFKC